LKTKEVIVFGTSRSVLKRLLSSQTDIVLVIQVTFELKITSVFLLIPQNVLVSWLNILEKDVFVRQD